ncbi:Rho GTPase activation protein [Gaertneriomyces semiglobifer]|nr:Rho GTPase activation protein [Gaertneriomyces semiglobifer]
MKSGKTPLGRLGSRSLQNLFAEKAVPPDKKLPEILLANNANLLAVICQCTFVGDTAANVSLGVLSLLRRQKENGTEAFLKRLLRARIEGYLTKSRDLSDIIRDNSMATMLLNAFARSEGLHYLGDCLKEPLQNVLPFIQGCEIDPIKLPSNMDPEDLQELITENESRLKSACSRLLLSIIERQDEMPWPIRRMCHYLKDTVEEMYEIGWTPRVALHRPATLREHPDGSDTSKVPVSSVDTTGSIANSRESLRVQSNAPGSRTASIDNVDRQSGAGAKVSPAKDGSPFVGTPPKEPFRLFRRRPRSSASSLSSSKDAGEDEVPISSGSTGSSEALANGRRIPPGNRHSKIATTPKGETPLRATPAPLETIASWPSGANSRSEGLSDIMATEVRRQKRLSDFGLPKHTVPIRASINSLPRAPSLMSNLRHGYLSVSEKVVGSFLFLRFFVPAITSPETYGLVEGSISPAARRGLVLCGKILTAMCNDVDFGNKEQYLMALNPFLRENREKVKDFLIFASSTDAEHANPEALPTSSSNSKESLETSPTGRAPSSSSGTEAMRKALSRSMPSLLKSGNDLPLNGGHNTGVTASKFHRTRSADFVDIDNFYTYLGRSLGKLEKEIDEQLLYLQPEESEGVTAGFMELKRVLENSSYADSGMYAPARSKRGSKDQTLFSKIGASFGGLFRGNKNKAQSLDDLNMSNSNVRATRALNSNSPS